VFLNKEADRTFLTSTPCTRSEVKHLNCVGWFNGLFTMPRTLVCCYDLSYILYNVYYGLCYILYNVYYGLCYILYSVYYGLC